MFSNCVHVYDDLTYFSDAFGQKFGNTPQKVNGFDNLSCLEVDTSGAESSWDDNDEAEFTGNVPPMLAGLEGGMVCLIVYCH